MLFPLLAAISRGYPVTNLERAGSEVATAADGEPAVALARELDPDVIVLDLMLPGIDGIEACRQIRAFSGAYIVMLTARVEEIDWIVGPSAGANDHATDRSHQVSWMGRVRAMLRRPRASRQPTGAVHIGNLRRKLGDDPRAPRYGLTIRGVGYRMGDGQSERDCQAV